MPRSLRIVLAGSVTSSLRTLEALIRHRADIVGVLELSEDSAGAVCGFVPLGELARAHGIPTFCFTQINHPDVVSKLKDWSPDLLFVVGLSQLVYAEILAIPILAGVGFHPTHLPRGRGRAPVAWLIEDNQPGAATFFVLTNEADAGAILVQEPFPVGSDSYAEDLVHEIDLAIDRALDRWLPQLLEGEWNPIPQDEQLATINGKRSPEDGLIDWMRSAEEIERLVRAASRPHPGAYSYLGDARLIIWRASLVPDCPYRGIPARILAGSAKEGYLIQTGNGVLKIEEWDCPRRISIGARLGYVIEDELHQLRKRVQELEQLLLGRRAA